MRAFLGEHCTHAAVAIFRASTQARFLQAPRGCLGVQITDIFELAGSKKSVAAKTYRSFHAPFFVPARDRHRARLEPIVSGQLPERRMEADRFGATPQDRAAKVVMSPHPRTRAPGGERLTVPRRDVV